MICQSFPGQQAEAAVGISLADPKKHFTQATPSAKSQIEIYVGKDVPASDLLGRSDEGFVKHIRASAF